MARLWRWGWLWLFCTYAHAAEVDLGTFIDNDAAEDSPGYIGAKIGDGGRSRRFRITEYGLSGQLYEETDILYDMGFYIDIGGNGGAFAIKDSQITQSATLVAPDRVQSRGYFSGHNSQQVDWVSTSWIDNGDRNLYHQIELSSSQPLGNMHLLHYLDEDIFSPNDDILVPSSLSGRVMTLDEQERLGFSHARDPSQAHSVQYLGWAADRYSRLRQKITGSSAQYSIDGHINQSNLPPFQDPDLGTVYGPKDVTSALAWSADAQATQLQVTAVLGSVTPQQATDPLAAIRGFRIQHDGSGVFYCPEQVQIDTLTHSGPVPADFQARIQIDTGVGHGHWQLHSGHGQLHDLGNGRAEYAFDPLDQGRVQLTLRLEQRSHTSLDLSVQALDNPGLVDDGLAGALQFADFGFHFVETHQSSLGQQRAGVPFSLDIQALNGDLARAQCQILSDYHGNKAVRLWQHWRDPQIGHTGIHLGTQALAQDGSPQARLIHFEQGVATVQARYDDVGRIALSLQDANHPSWQGNSADFTVVPHHLHLSAPATGNGLWVAGEAFSLVLEARNQQGQVSANFGHELGSVQTHYTHNVLSPSAAAQGLLSGPSARVLGAGQHRGQFEFDEVGRVSIEARLSEYLGESLSLSAQASLDRFVPHHFAISATAGAYRAECAGQFTFLGQDFGFSQAPQLIAEAQNAHGASTLNYRDNHQHLSASSVQVEAPSQDNRALDRTGQAMRLQQRQLSVSPPTALGNGRYGFGLSADFRYRRDSLEDEIASFATDLPLRWLSLQDADGVAGQSLPLSFTPTATAIRFGRLRALPAVGAPSQPLTAQLLSEYLDHSGQYQLNSEDSCSQVQLQTVQDLDPLDGFNFTLASTWQQGIQPLLGVNTALNAGLLSYQLPAIGAYDSGHAHLVFQTPSHLDYPWLSPLFGAAQTQVLYRNVVSPYAASQIIHIRENF